MVFNVRIVSAKLHSQNIIYYSGNVLFFFHDMIVNIQYIPF